MTDKNPTAFPTRCVRDIAKLTKASAYSPGFPRRSASSLPNGEEDLPENWLPLVDPRDMAKLDVNVSLSGQIVQYVKNIDPHDETKLCVAKQGDIILSMLPGSGCVAVVADKPVAITGPIVRLSDLDKDADPYFVAIALSSVLDKVARREESPLRLYAGLRQAVSACEVPFPDRSTQEKLVSKIKAYKKSSAELLKNLRKQVRLLETIEETVVEQLTRQGRISTKPDYSGLGVEAGNAVSGVRVDRESNGSLDQKSGLDTPVEQKTFGVEKAKKKPAP